MTRPLPYDRSKLPTTSLFTNTSAPPPPPRVLLINKFTESRAPELESLHSIVSARLNHDFCLRRDKRRRTNGFRRGKNQRRKRRRLADGAADAVGDGRTEAPDSVGKEKKLSRRVRRRLELRRNPAFGFCVSRDGTKRLRTHLWHAKRFTMVKRWGFYLPLGLHGRGKCSRAVLKWLKSGALIHDASYIHPVQLEGPEESIMEIMRVVLRPLPSGVSAKISSPVVHGICYANSMLYHVRSAPPTLIAPVSYMWRPLKRGENSMYSEQLDGCSSSSRSECNTSLRQLWIWIHPASYSEGFDALRCACQKQMNETGISVRCISMEGHIARLEVIGAKSLEILQKILNPIPELHRIGTQSLLSCSSLQACSNSRLPSHFVLENAMHLPPRAIFSLAVQDPRDLPVKETKLFPTTNSSVSCLQQDGHVQDSTDKISEESTGDEDLFLSLWSEPEKNGVFLSDCRQLWDSSIIVKPPLPEKVICNEKHRTRLKHCYLDSSHLGESGNEGRDGYDQSCHILLLRHADHGINLGWSLLLPLSWVKPFWMSLISNGAHAIGLREKRWIACSSGLPSFPNDFPDSTAYSSLMTAEAATADETAKLRPPAVRPITVPLTPPWDCVVHTLNRESNVDKSCYTDRETAHELSSNIESQDYKQLYPEQVGEPFKVSISRTSSNLNYQLGKISCEGYLEQVGGPFFVRVIIRAFKEGSFEEGAVVCAPTLADLPAWMSRNSRSDEHEPLQMPQSFIKSYFTRQDSGKWELQVPEECSTLKWYRWPIGFITTGFVRGSSKPVAVAICESRLLEQLKVQQASKMESAGPEIFVLVRNLKSTTYRRALATIFVSLHDEDLDFL